LVCVTNEAYNITPETYLIMGMFHPENILVVTEKLVNNSIVPKLIPNIHQIFPSMLRIQILCLFFGFIDW
jgi:hypothetical protein